MSLTFYFLFIIPGVILAYIVYLVIGHYRHRKKKTRSLDIIDILESELKRIKEDD